MDQVLRLVHGVLNLNDILFRVMVRLLVALHVSTYSMSASV